MVQQLVVVNFPRLDTLEHFISGQAGFKPDVIVIAGLHMLEKEPLDFRTKRLNEVWSSDILL